MRSLITCEFELCLVFFFFFFQAEDGIRDHCVTGVQTCALPISVRFLIVGDGSDREWLSQNLAAADLPGILRGEALAGIGRGAGRERGEISGVAVSLKKKKDNQ